MARPKGSGAIKFLDPGKHDFPAIRQSLHAGAPPQPLSPQATRLILWRQQYARYTKRGIRTPRLDREWRDLGVVLGGLNDEQFPAVLSEVSQYLQKASQPPTFGWQLAATRLVELAYLLSGTNRKLNSPRKATLALTVKQLSEQMRELMRVEGWHGNFTLYDLRRFVRDTLKTKLRSEQGKR